MRLAQPQPTPLHIRQPTGGQAVESKQRAPAIKPRTIRRQLDPLQRSRPDQRVEAAAQKPLHQHRR
ncbi:MAG TPA: hypothetical protein DIW77_23905 [Chromatiaceae bacterium]|nr:hypothetical protein [Chromatiaceae bacterium]